MSSPEDFTGTRPVSAQHAFDEGALGAWLTHHVEGFTGPLALESFKGGQSNPTYKLSTSDATYVLRTKPAAQALLLPSAHAIEREFKVMHGLHGTEVPVPRMLALCEDESVIGRAFYVMEFMEGRVFWDQSLPGLSPPERAAIYDEMNRVISSLHRVAYAEHGLGDFGRPGIHPTQPRVIAVLDWELSTLGHPLADFSYHAMAWNIAPGDFRGIHGLDLAGLGIPDQTSYLARYCERTGLVSLQDLQADWNFYMAYNLFRMAAILQGIAKRVEDGTAASAQALRAAAGARPLARLGWQFAQQA
ncbi:MAG: phosphotransferase family protein [Betaproteobacteria bacterium]|nr:phosphotransferase family protein [Betaproteobacteria bacterium]